MHDWEQICKTRELLSLSLALRARVCTGDGRGGRNHAEESRRAGAAGRGASDRGAAEVGRLSRLLGANAQPQHNTTELQ